jgi:hypothetical protein
VGLLEDRVAEGRAKGGPMDRIALAVERRAEALATAQSAMRPVAPRLSNADLVAGANAVESGIPAGALRQVVQNARAEDRPVAISVLTFLHLEQGMPVEQALDRVTEALARGPEALRNLPAQAAAARRGPPADRPGPVGGAGRPDQPGPPSGVPGPGQRPGGARPDGAGGGPPAGGGGPPSGRGPGG